MFYYYFVIYAIYGVPYDFEDKSHNIIHQKHKYLLFLCKINTSVDYRHHHHGIVTPAKPQTLT